jgi:predicted  nucleic acid-binding Zn-ribbon protein
MTKSKLLVALLAGVAFSLPATAKLYKWVDEKGTTHYGETIPPEYANKDRAELNKAGREVNKKEILTPEERATKEQVDAKKREEEQAAQEQKRRDKALLNTYSNSKEIDLARSRNLQQVEGRINSATSQIKMANENLLGFQKEADALTKAGKKIHPTLQEDLKESQARLDKLQQQLEKSKAEKASVEARYDADKARYKELTGR